MLNDAPVFSDVAAQVYELLKDAIFVAHHVNFDYSFVKHQLECCGYELDTKKLCTVRLSRKVFPGLTGYSLGKLCRELEIPITNRHRAGGDADATVILFEKILKNDNQGAVRQMLYGKSREQYLPPNLPAEQIAFVTLHSGRILFP